MTTTVNLPDGSVVHLNSESKLSYPSFFDKDKRRVTLQGEAFFEVQKDPEHGFVISTPHETKIEVLVLLSMSKHLRKTILFLLP